MAKQTVADAAVVAALAARLERLAHDQVRVWGAMSAHQMIVHLGDAAEAVLQRRNFAAPFRPPRRIMKFVALNLPLPWPRNIRTGAPPAPPVPADAFDRNRARAVATLRELASAPADALVATHPIFGPMTQADWHRWAFLHIDHHLRQFGI
jgi:hypothetical protein